MSNHFSNRISSLVSLLMFYVLQIISPLEGHGDGSKGSSIRRKQQDGSGHPDSAHCIPSTPDRYCIGTGLYRRHRLVMGWGGLLLNGTESILVQTFVWNGDGLRWVKHSIMCPVGDCICSLSKNRCENTMNHSHFPLNPCWWLLDSDSWENLNSLCGVSHS